MDNKELNAVVSVLRGYAEGRTGLRKPALIKIHELLIEDLAKHRKIKLDDVNVSGDEQ